MSKIDLDYVKELEVYRDLYFKQQDQIQKQVEDIRMDTIKDIIKRVQTKKGLEGKMSMGEWSNKMIGMLTNLNNQSHE